MELSYLLFAFLTGSLFLLGCLLLLNVTRVNTIANRWLGIFSFCLGFAFFQQFLERSGMDGQYPLLSHSTEWSRFALAPALYLAILNFVSTEKVKTNLLHFIPFVLFAVWSIVVIIPAMNGPAHSVLPSYLGIALSLFGRAQLIIYWILSWIALARHRRNIRNIASSIDQINLNWITMILAAGLMMIIIRFLGSVSREIYSLSPIIYCLAILMISYYSVIQETVYPMPAADLTDVNALLTRTKKHERLTQDQVQAVTRRIMDVMNSQKLYLDPTLNLPSLGKHIGINTHEISYAINQGMQKSFYQLVNEMRVDEAKKLLLSEKLKHLDMLGIAFSSGFNSKTTFNTTFKRLTGQSPSDFVKYQQ